MNIVIRLTILVESLEMNPSFEITNTNLALLEDLRKTLYM